MTQSINARRGAELRALRRAANMTQAAFAAEIGVTKNALARQERGEIGMRETVLRLARVISERQGS